MYGEESGQSMVLRTQLSKVGVKSPALGYFPDPTWNRLVGFLVNYDPAPLAK